MYNGSCLCGNVRYEISGRIHDIVCCHCSKCRKAQGSAFATNGNVKLEEFRFIRGEDGLCGYESPPGHIKFFCTSCGSPIMSKNDRFPDQVRIRLGTLESDISERPQAHIHVGSKACWEEITDSLPQHLEAMPVQPHQE